MCTPADLVFTSELVPLFETYAPPPRGVKDSHSFTFHLCTLSRGVVLQSWFALYRRGCIKNQIPGAILHA